ncbi:MAG: hypothetical protein VW935_18555, partial [Novosphingobium sp.]
MTGQVMKADGDLTENHRACWIAREHFAQFLADLGIISPIAGQRLDLGDDAVAPEQDIRALTRVARRHKRIDRLPASGLEDAGDEVMLIHRVAAGAFPISDHGT